MALRTDATWLAWPALALALPGRWAGRWLTEHTPIYLQQQRVTMTTGSTRSADSVPAIGICICGIVVANCVCATVFVCVRLVWAPYRRRLQRKIKKKITTTQHKKKITKYVTRTRQIFSEKKIKPATITKPQINIFFSSDMEKKGNVQCGPRSFSRRGGPMEV